MTIINTHMITYPRKCPDCEYVANNPAMYGYHIKTHTPIPEGTLCCGGCGLPAMHTTTSGKCWCDTVAHRCPAVRQTTADRVKKGWSENDWADRRATNASRTRNETPEQTKARSAKQSKTKQAKMRAAEHSMEKKRYQQAAIRYSRKTYTLYTEEINPENLPIGKQQYHLEHKVSRHIGFLMGIPLEYICSKHNLTVIHHLTNSAKGPSCSLMPLELLELCGASETEKLRVQALQLHLIEAGVL